MAAVVAILTEVIRWRHFTKRADGCDSSYPDWSHSMTSLHLSRSRVTTPTQTILTEFFRGFTLFPQTNAATRVQTTTASFHIRYILIIWLLIVARFWQRLLHIPQTKPAFVKASPSVERRGTVSCAATGVVLSAGSKLFLYGEDTDRPPRRRYVAAPMQRSVLRPHPLL